MNLYAYDTGTRDVVGKGISREEEKGGGGARAGLSRRKGEEGGKPGKRSE